MLDPEKIAGLVVATIKASLVSVTERLTAIETKLATVRDGEKGERGDEGKPGAQGDIGPMGLTGPKGDQGERGLDGSVFTSGNGVPLSAGQQLHDLYFDLETGDVYRWG